MQHNYTCDVCGKGFMTYCFGSPQGGDVVFEPPLPDPREYWPKPEAPQGEFVDAIHRQAREMFASKMIALCTEHLEEYNAKI